MILRDSARHNFCELLERQELGGLLSEGGRKRRACFSVFRKSTYVAVRAHAEGGACFNVTQLFVSGRTGEFRKVFEAEPTKSDDGNGMRLIGWNREGTKLMAELGQICLRVGRAHEQGNRHL